MDLSLPAVAGVWTPSALKVWTTAPPASYNVTNYYIMGSQLVIEDWQFAVAPNRLTYTGAGPIAYSTEGEPLQSFDLLTPLCP